MNLISTRARKGTAVAFGAVAASAALVLGGMTAASAADFQIGPEDVAGYENGVEGSAGYNYDQWHIGSTTNPDAGVEDSLTFNECSVEFLEPPAGANASVTQLLVGSSPDDRLSDIEDIEDVLDSLAVTMESGSVTLQVPLFIYEDEGADPDFTTVRNTDPFTTAGTHGLEGEPLTATRGFGPFADTDDLLDFIESVIDGGGFVEVLGVGITGEPGSIVTSFSVLGDTAFFGTGDCLPGGGPGDGDDDDDDDDAPQAPTRPVAVETGH